MATEAVIIKIKMKMLKIFFKRQDLDRQSVCGSHFTHFYLCSMMYFTDTRKLYVYKVKSQMFMPKDLDLLEWSERSSGLFHRYIAYA